jgi:hypothetical protein
MNQKTCTNKQDVENKSQLGTRTRLAIVTAAISFTVTICILMVAHFITAPGKAIVSTKHLGSVVSVEYTQPYVAFDLNRLLPFTAGSTPKMIIHTDSGPFSFSTEFSVPRPSSQATIVEFRNGDKSFCVASIRDRHCVGLDKVLPLKGNQ